MVNKFLLISIILKENLGKKYVVKQELAEGEKGKEFLVRHFNV